MAKGRCQNGAHDFLTDHLRPMNNVLPSVYFSRNASGKGAQVLFIANV